MIPYGRQEISEEDIQQVIKVLRSDFLTQGPYIPEFEKALSTYCRATHGVAVNSATSALHIACLALGVGEGDVVWTSPVTFVASANCALYCGAAVDFVDIDPATYNLSAVELQKKLEATVKNGGKIPKVVIPVHLCGQPCDMAAIHALSVQYNFAIIEDASHAIGGKYKNAPIGNCEYSDITVFSFHPVKIITTAEGGMAVTNDAALAGKMARYRSHGITRDTALMTEESHGPWYYQQIELGFNYRMTELQAALGVSQLKKLDDFVAARHRLASRYDQLLQGLPLSIPHQHEDGYSGLHLYVIRINTDAIENDHLAVFNSLREDGIGVNLHYTPVHIQPYYRNMGFKHGDFPHAENYYKKAISLPMFHHMSEDQQDQVVFALKNALGRTNK